MSQLDLALETEISQKHLSFVESGRATASRDMVLRLADGLDVPKRERNTLLLAAGFAPVFRERALGDPSMAAVRTAVVLVLDAYAPFPAIAVDHHWIMLAANTAVPPLLAGISPDVLRPPVNVLRLSLHPDGLAPRIVNLAEWRAHIIERLKRQIATTGDAVLADLCRELSAIPGGPHRKTDAARAGAEHVFVPLRLQTDRGILDLISTTTLFGTPLDITMSEIAIEAFLPANAYTADTLSSIARENATPGVPASGAGEQP